MSYRIEYFCGLKYGGWRPAGPTYTHESEAIIAAQSQEAAERAYRLTPLARRVRAAAS